MDRKHKHKNFPPYAVYSNAVAWNPQYEYFVNVRTGRSLEAVRDRPFYDRQYAATQHYFLAPKHTPNDYRMFMWGEQAAAILHYRLPEATEIVAYARDGNGLNCAPANIIASGRLADGKSFMANAEDGLVIVDDYTDIERDILRMNEQWFHSARTHARMTRLVRPTSPLRLPTKRELEYCFEYNPFNGLFRVRDRDASKWIPGYVNHNRTHRFESTGHGSSYFLRSYRFPRGTVRQLPADKAAIIMQTGMAHESMKVFHQNFDTADNRAVNLAALIPTPSDDPEILAVVHKNSEWAKFKPASPRSVDKFNEWLFYVMVANDAINWSNHIINELNKEVVF